jgi:hypothetical protein
MEQRPARTEGVEDSRRDAMRRALRGPVRGMLAPLVLLVVAGVTAAALFRPGISGPSEDVTRAGDREGTISLANLGRADAPRDEGPVPTDPPAKAPEVIGVGTGQFSGGATAGVEDVDGYDPAQAQAPTDDEIRQQLAAFRDHIGGMDPRKGARAYIDKHGRAVLPKGAPRKVALVVAAANEIATKPYKWGGGHGAWKDSGYDCSGSVSFALAGARLLDRPLSSSGFLRYGDGGPGEWISVYTHSGHMFMTVAGLRFDTSGQGTAGTRWQRASRSTAGFTVRHPPGL